MIVNHVRSGWEVIYQYAHGLLAGQIGHQIRHELRPPRWVDSLAAIINHDDYMLDFSEKSYLDEQGAPLDFTLESPSDDDRLAHAERLIVNARRKSGWIALLVSQHLEFLYREASAENTDMKRFLDEQETARREWRKRYGVNSREATAAYRFLRFCDRTSLILCRGEVPAMGRQLEINQAMEGKRYFIQEHSRQDGAITVTPWCFADDEFRVAVDVQHLKQLQFKDNDELATALATAEVEVREWRFCRP